MAFKSSKSIIMYLLSTKLNYSKSTRLNLDFDMLKCSENVFVLGIIL